MKRSRKIVPVPISGIKVVNSRGRNRIRFKELVRSVATLGLKRPITVSKRKNTSLYELVCGERRMKAFTALGQTQIPALLVDVSTEDCILMSLIENIARRRHPPVELVTDIVRLSKHYRVTEIAAKIDVSEEFVRAVVYLLKHGEERLVNAVERGMVPPTLAVEIAKAKNPKVQGALLATYLSERHTSNQIRNIRKLVEQRYRTAVKSSGGKIESSTLVRAYRQETERQQLLARKADFAHARLTFIINALKTLLNERMFVSLLREESLDKLPLPVLRGISSTPRGSHDG